MNKIINHIKQADKRRLLIYLLSYAIYRLINNSFSYSVLTLLNEESFRDRWTSLRVPCDTPHIFLILFQVFKVLLFIAFIRLIKQKAKGLLSEIFIAYFIYDLVYILAYMWMFIPFPDNLSLWWMFFLTDGPKWTLNSSGQIFLYHYLPYLDLIFAVLWTTALFIVLKLRNRLSFMFLINRLTIIPVSVFLILWVIYLVGRLI
jgi:hypothetical protein